MKTKLHSSSVTRRSLFALLATLAVWLAAVPARAQTDPSEFTYTTNNGTITITGYTGSGVNVSIPGTIYDLPVTGIGPQAFYHCTSLTSVTIPDSVTGIGYFAFARCTSLTSVAIGTGVTYMETGVFSTCPNLTVITVHPLNSAYSSSAGILFNEDQTTLIQYPASKPGSSYSIPDSVALIAYGAFSGCTGLTSVTIPNSVTNIVEYAFAYCPKLSSVTISASVISDYAFQLCANLTNVTFGTNVTSIGTAAFFQSTSLGSITIPDSVTNLGGYAFGSCASLTNIMIGNGVTSVQDFTFIECTQLTRVTIPNSVTNLGFEAFDYSSNLTRVYFLGDAPGDGSDGSVFSSDVQATLYYLPGTTGWHTPFDGRPAVLWNPQVQTGDASFGMQPDHFGFTITGTADIPIVVEVCTNLACAQWIPLHTCTVTNGSIYFCDEQAPNHPERYYRLRAP